MNRLNSLIEAAKADCVKNPNDWVSGNLNGWGKDVLELCALLEKAEEAMVWQHARLEMFDPETPEEEVVEVIKQWKDRA